MGSPVEIWPAGAGLVILALGLIFARKDFSNATGLDKLVALGLACFAAPLATFGGEHLVVGRSMVNMVPRWIPAHLFWIYFVGLGLEAAALSLTFRKCLLWSASLLAIMFFIFVFTIDIPSTFAQPKNRLLWVLVFRETSFALGSLALAATTIRNSRAQLSNIFTLIARILIGVTLIFYGVQHFLHPDNVLGVPLEKLTPAWVPIPHFWAALVGAVLLVCGAALLFNKRARLAATLAGLVMVAITLFLYTPIWTMDRGTEQVVEGMNYVFDTLFYGGAMLLVAAAIPKKDVQS